MIETERKILGLVGLAARAGGVVAGTVRVRDAARDGRLRLAILAQDSSENARSKLVPSLLSARVAMVERFDRIALGEAVGRAPVSAVGLTDASLAARIRALLDGLGRGSEVTGRN